MRMVAHIAGQPAEAEVILLGGSGAEPGRQQANDELGKVIPVAGRADLGLDVVGKGIVVLESTGGVQIAGEQVVSVGISVEPWIEAWPRRARMPPPGRPILPRSDCRIVAARIV